MLFLLSPAKSLDFSPAPASVPRTRPLFVPQAQSLIALLRDMSPQQIAQLMHLSDSLAGLNVARYQNWKPQHSLRNAKQALLAFDGDVYDGLAASSLCADDLAWAQQHMCILSGLYGVLRPLDAVQPYRLEMGTALENPCGNNLYQFWGRQLADYLNQRLQRDRHPVVLNLASAEYFKAIDLRVLKARVVTCVFEDFKDGAFKIISFYAKRARGLMARYAITQRASLPEHLQGFEADGYVFSPVQSSPDRLVFRRHTRS